MEVVHPDAAGIDIGNESHYVAVPPDRDSHPVQCFGCTTAELKAMADWLNRCGISTVAMQSTGVYWIAVFDILEAAGLEVYLVSPLCNGEGKHTINPNCCHQHEIGMRMVLGALPTQVLGMVVSNGLRTALWGVAAGLVLGSLLARLLRNLLFEVRPLDPTTYAAAVCMFLRVTLLASYLPARRAARVAPSVALRHE